MSRRKRAAILRQIEHKTQRTVTILPDLLPTPYTPRVTQQRHSKFFTLPPELRLQVYELVSAPYPDPQRAYKPSAPYYRPGYEAAPKTYWLFLLACRRVWLEANHLPLKLATHTFWFGDGPCDNKSLMDDVLASYGITPSLSLPRKCQQSRETDRYQAFFHKLTPLNFTQLTHVHIFANEYWTWSLYADGMPAVSFNPAWFNARRLTITLRHAQLKFWTNDPKHSWLGTLLTASELRDVEEVVVEFEIKTEQRARLQRHAAAVALQHSERFKSAGRAVITTWTRPTEDTGGKDRTYHVLTAKWASIRLDTSENLKRKRQEGFSTRGGHLVYPVFEYVKQWKIGRKRGGRRSQPVRYRNQWQDMRLSLDARQAKMARRGDLAAEWTEHCETEGSLLRLL